MREAAEAPDLQAQHQHGSAPAPSRGAPGRRVAAPRDRPLGPDWTVISASVLARREGRRGAEVERWRTAGAGPPVLLAARRPCVPAILVRDHRRHPHRRRPPEEHHGHPLSMKGGGESSHGRWVRTTLFAGAAGSAGTPGRATPPGELALAAGAHLAAAEWRPCAGVDAHLKHRAGHALAGSQWCSSLYRLLHGRIRLNGRLQAGPAQSRVVRRPGCQRGALPEPARTACVG
jgi:hypothetical protein